MFAREHGGGAWFPGYIRTKGLVHKEGRSPAVEKKAGSDPGAFVIPGRAKHEL
jgi:hypothetical protein